MDSAPRGQSRSTPCRHLHARTQIGRQPRHRDPAPARRRTDLSQRSPGKRCRYANLRANPQLTLHVRSRAEGNVEMTARAIIDTGERREVLSPIASPNELEAWIEGSPLVELIEV
jgi:hypothetical protein